MYPDCRLEAKASKCYQEPELAPKEFNVCTNLNSDSPWCYTRTYPNRYLGGLDNPVHV